MWQYALVSMSHLYVLPLDHKRIRYAENSSEADLASFTPAFLWLLRDFYLSLEEEGRAVSYMQ